MPVVGVGPADPVDLEVAEEVLQHLADVLVVGWGELVGVLLPDDHGRAAARAVDHPAEIVLVVAVGPRLALAQRAGHRQYPMSIELDQPK